MYALADSDHFCCCRLNCAILRLLDVIDVAAIAQTSQIPDYLDMQDLVRRQDYADLVRCFVGGAEAAAVLAHLVHEVLSVYVYVPNQLPLQPVRLEILVPASYIAESDSDTQSE